MNVPTASIFWRVFLLTGIFLCACASSAEEAICKGLENNVLERTPHKKCIADHFPELVDFYMNFPSCTVFVSMARIDDPELLEQKMELGFTHYRNFLPSPPCPEGGGVYVEFREVDAYPFLQLYAWAEQAEPLIKYIEPDSYANVMIFDGELSVHLETAAAVARVGEILDEIGIPRDAHTVTSREEEIANMPSLAPIVEKGSKNDRILLPVYFWNGDKATDLVLGRMTLGDATHILPPWPGHGPSRESQSTPRSERSPWVNEDMHAAIDSIRYSYAPARTFVALAFDRKKRLILANYEVQEGQEAKLIDGISELAPLNEIYRDDSALVRRAQIGSCITADLGAGRREEEPYKLFSVVYVFICEPGRER